MDPFNWSDGSRREFLTLATLGAAGTMLTGVAAARELDVAAPRGPASLTRPKCLFFDVNETLLDLEAMKQSVARALGGRADLLPLWFTTMLQYSLVATVGEKYDDFGVIGAAALQMVARGEGIELSDAAAREAIRPIRSLPPHPDVAPALAKLRQADFRMATLTNSSHATIDAQIENAGLTEFFDERLSIADIKKYKPHRQAYEWAAHRMGVAPSDCLLIAAHGWDIAGAQWAGWQGAFLARPGAQLYPLASVPVMDESNLLSIANRLIEMKS